MSKIALVSLVVSLVSEMALHPALEPAGTQESVDGKMMGPSKAM